MTSPDCTVTIVIRDVAPGRAAAAAAALGPDNVGFPDGMSMRTAVAREGGESGGARLTLEFESRGGAGIASLASTIDEVLSHVQVALGVTAK